MNENPWGKLKITKITDPVLIGWLAGLLEGEESFGFWSNRAVISLQMTDKDVVEKAARLVGTTFHEITPKQAHHKIVFVMNLKSARAIYIMKLIYPYMGERRKKKIFEVISKYETNLAKRIERISSLNRNMPDEQLKEAWEKWDSGSFREFARSLNYTHETLRQRLMKLKLYPKQIASVAQW